MLHEAPETCVHLYVNVPEGVVPLPGSVTCAAGSVTVLSFPAFADSDAPGAGLTTTVASSDWEIPELSVAVSRNTYVPWDRFDSDKFMVFELVKVALPPDTFVHE